MPAPGGIAMEEEREYDDTQLEEESSDDGGNESSDNVETETEVEDNGDGADETQVVAPEIEGVGEDAARTMEEEDEDPGDSREAQAVEACGSVEDDDGGRRGGEPTQATQIDSPHAPTQQDEDSDNTESRNPTPLFASPSVGQAADRTGVRRTPSPLRRNGLGSGVFLSRGGRAGAGAGAADTETISGFLSSAEPSANATRDRAASPVSLQPLPQGWLDDEPNVARAAATEGARAQAMPKRDRERVQHAGKSASTNEEGAAVPKKPSPAKAVAVTTGWIRTKGSPSKGKARKAPPVSAAAADAAGDDDDEHATAQDTQDGSVSQSILAIGVPHKHHVLEPPRPRTTQAAGAAAAATADADQEEEEEEEDDDEEEEMLAAGATGGTVNSQELKATDFSQIGKGCSQDKNNFDRMMDDAIAGAAAGSGAADPKTGALEEGSPQQAQPGGQGVNGGDGGGGGGGGDLKDTGRGGGGKRKKMKARAQVTAGNGGAKTPRGGVAGRKGAAGSRTPGAYMGGLGAPSSAKKRAVPSHPDSANQRPHNVFDITSDDDDDSDGSGGAGGRSSTPSRRRQPASNGVASSGRNKGKIKKKAVDPVAVSKAPQTARGDHGENLGREVEEEEEEEEEDCAVVDVSNMHGNDGGDDRDDDDDDHDGDDQIVRTTQDVQMEKAMAAIRKDASSVSAQEEEEKEEEEKEAEHKEEGREDVEGEEGGEGGGGADTTAGEPSAAGRRGRVMGSGSNLDAKARARRVRRPEPCPPELTYKAMDPFLKNEGWEVVDGKGLFTWFYLIPERKGKLGEKDVDFYVSEQEVVQHVRNDEDALARYEAFRKGRRPGGHGGGGGGGRRSSSGSTESAARRGKRKARGETNAGSSAAAAAAGTAAGSAPAQQVIRSRGQGSEQARGRRQAERPPERLSGRARRHGAIDWVQKWRDEWPKLKEEGWYWDYGKSGCIYLKRGFTKKTCTPGVNMFGTRQAVLEYVFVHGSAAVAEPAADDSAESAARESVEQGGEGDAGTRAGDVEPVAEWGLAKNRVRRGAVDTNSAAPEVMVLPGRAGGRKFARPPTASTVQRGESSCGRSAAAGIQDDGRSASRGSGQPTPRAQGGSKRGRGRGAVTNPGVERGRAGGAKQPPEEIHGDAGADAGADPGADKRREMESGEDAVDDEHDEVDNAETQPQFELSSAINLTKLGSRHVSVNPAASTAAVAAVGATSSRAPEEGLPRASSATLSKLPRPPNGSPTASNSGGGGGSGSGSGNDANGVAGVALKKKSSASSPPNSSSSAPGGGGVKRKKQTSPTAGNDVRSSSRGTPEGPLSGLGVVVTGLRGEKRQEFEANIQKLGGEVVNILSKKAPAPEWRKWLLIEAALGAVAGRERPSALTSDGGETTKSKVGAKPDSANTTQPQRRMIAVATPDSDRTPKFQLAMAAGMPIVHPRYVAACTSMATEVEPTGYLLPLGRSALLGRGLIMPSPPSSARDRPFQGKTIMLCMHGVDAENSALDNWVFTLGVAGATVKVLQEDSDDRKGAGGGAGFGLGLGAGVDASLCTLEAALKLLEGGEVFCVIGPKRVDGDAVPSSLVVVEGTAVRAGTPAGSLEWAIQCMAQGRLLLPDAGTCPWFPLGAVGGVVEKSGSVDKRRKGRGGGGSSGRGRGCGAGRGGASRGKSSGGKSGPFHVHVSEGKRYVSGDYVFLEKEKEKGTASNKSGGAAAATAAASDRPRVARIISFRREGDGKVKVAMTPMKRGDGEKVLVASGRKDAEEEEEEEEEVGEEVLGARVLGMTNREMQATQLYSLQDSGIFCLSG